jgi:serine-threonine kinase receptor-associated protein
VFLISACHDKTAMIRSGETGDWIGTFEGHKGAVWGASLNPPATRAATCSGDFSAKVWDALTGDELLELKHRHIVRSCDWSPDSVNLVTGGKEAKLRLYDLHQPDSEPNVLLGHETGKAIKVVRYLPDPSGKVFLSAGDDKTLRLWDVRSLSEVSRLDFDGPVNSVELSRDEKTLTVAAGTEVSFWDTTSYQCLKRFTLGVIEANGYGVNSATLHPERKAFVAGGGNFWVYVHDYETGARPQQPPPQQHPPPPWTRCTRACARRLPERCAPTARACCSRAPSPPQARSSCATRGTTAPCTGCASRPMARRTPRAATTAPSASGRLLRPTPLLPRWPRLPRARRRWTWRTRRDALFSEKI